MSNLSIILLVVCYLFICNPLDDELIKFNIEVQNDFIRLVLTNNSEKKYMVNKRMAYGCNHTELELKIKDEFLKEYPCIAKINISIPEENDYILFEPKRIIEHNIHISHLKFFYGLSDGRTYTIQILYQDKWCDYYKDKFDIEIFKDTILSNEIEITIPDTSTKKDK